MASTAQLALLDRLCPEFAGMDDRGDFIDDAAYGVTLSYYGSQYDRVLVLRAAHRMEMRKRRKEGNQGTGAVSSQGEGFVNYASPNAADAFWKATPHGLEFLDIRERCRKGPMIIGLGGF